MNRRTFLLRLGAAAVAVTLARHLPGIAPQPFEWGEAYQVGDVFTFAGKFLVNPLTGRADPALACSSSS